MPRPVLPRAMATPRHLAIGAHRLTGSPAAPTSPKSPAGPVATAAAFCVLRERRAPVAAAVMRTLLQPVPHQVGHVLAAGLYRPAETESMVGGDLFDIRATQAGERAIIGDV